MRFRRSTRKVIAPLGQVRRPLTADDMDAFNEAASQRTSGQTPSLLDLLAMADRLMDVNPIKARAVKVDLKWLMKAGDHYLNSNWEHPWGK